jgi:hypothetical protein
MGDSAFEIVPTTNIVVRVACAKHLAQITGETRGGGIPTKLNAPPRRVCQEQSP